MIETALADVQPRKAGVDPRRPHPRRSTPRCPTTSACPTAPTSRELLDRLTDEALTLARSRWTPPGPGDALLPDELRLANGESAYAAPGATLYATPEHVRTERLLRRRHAQPAVRRRCPQQVAAPVPRRAARVGASSSGVDQAAAVRGVLTSGARVETLVGPAGTGKSFVVGALARAWTDPALRGARRPGAGVRAGDLARSPPTSSPAKA